MFVLSCIAQALDGREMVDYTRTMIASGTELDFGPSPVADKHCIGGVPGKRTTMIVVPILSATQFIFARPCTIRCPSCTPVYSR